MSAWPSRGGPHQRRLAAPLLARVNRGAVREQDLRGVDVARSGRRHQRRFAFVTAALASAPALSSLSMIAALPLRLAR